MGDIATFCSGGTPLTSKREYFDGDIPFIRSGEINSDKTEQFITELGLKNSSAKLVNAGDILYALYGATSGEVGISKINGAINQAILCIKSTENHYFIFSFLSHKKEVITRTYLQGGQGNLSAEIVKQIELSIPSINEQQKMSNFLLLVDDRIQTQKKIIEKLETLMKGNRERIFSQKLRFKNEQGSDFPTWERKKIKEILTIGSGKDYKHLNDGTIPVYGTGGVIAFVDSFLYDGATVCIGRKGTIDKPLYYNGKIWTVDTLFYTHSFNNSVPKFVFNVFQNINWKEYNEASGVPSLSKNTIENIEISIPCLEEQYKIVNFLSSIQEKIETEKQILEKLELQKKFLLANLFV